MTSFFNIVLEMSLTSVYVSIGVIIVRLFLKRSPKIFSYIAWLAVAFRLLCPISIESVLSLLPQNNGSEDIPRQIISIVSPESSIAFSESPSPNLLADETFNPLPQPAPFTFHDIAPYIWLLGVLVLLIYMISSYTITKNKLNTATIIKSNIYESDRILSPFVFGIIKPQIYLPIGILEDEYELIILHEQIHIRRFDYLIKPVSFLIVVFHWFNPFVWLSYYLMVKDMEMSCDERVLKSAEKDFRKAYSETLLKISMKRSGLLRPISFGESNIKSRIKNILAYKRPMFWTSVVAIVGLIGAIIGMSLNPIKGNNDDILEEENNSDEITIVNGDNYSIKDKGIPLLGGELDSSGNILLKALPDCKTDYDTYRQYFFGTWKDKNDNGGSNALILDDSELSNNRLLLNGKVGRMGDNVIFNYYIDGGIGQLYWLDITQPTIMYYMTDVSIFEKENGQHSYSHLNLGVMSKDIKMINQSSNGYLSRLKLLEMSDKYGVDFNLLSEISDYTTDYGQTFRLDDLYFSNGIYLVSESFDKIILKSKLNSYENNIFLDVIYTVENKNGLWKQSFQISEETLLKAKAKYIENRKEFLYDTVKRDGNSIYLKFQKTEEIAGSICLVFEYENSKVEENGFIIYPDDDTYAISENGMIYRKDAVSEWEFLNPISFEIDSDNTVEGLKTDASDVVSELIRQKQEENSTANFNYEDKFIWPTEEKFKLITAYFGSDESRGGQHLGIDIGNSDIGGAQVYAAKPGIIIEMVGNGAFANGYGNHIIIDHGNGLETLYGHLETDSITATIGDRIESGAVIGKVGSTGLVTGDCLHFEVRVNGVVVNPLDYEFEFYDDYTA